MNEEGDIIVSKNLKFCEHCKKNVESTITKEDINYTIHGKPVMLKSDVIRCKDCGEELNDNELFEVNSKLAREKYIKQYNIVSPNEILSLLHLYNISPSVLSIIIFNNNMTIKKLCSGKLPTPEESEKLKEITTNPAVVIEMLKEKKTQISDTECTMCEHIIQKLIK